MKNLINVAKLCSILFFLMFNLMVTNGAVPAITSFSPSSGTVGTTVTISGTNFNTTAANNIVFFGATRAAITTVSASSLTVKVPAGATYQSISVTDITTGLTGYSARPFVTTFAGGGSIGPSSFDNKADNTTGNGPNCVAIGDLDGDGKPDLAVVNSSSNTVSTFRNTSTSGSISFAAKVDFTTGYYPNRVIIADLNGDGKPDLAVTNRNSYTISVFRNTSASGSVSFAAKVDYATGSGPMSITTGDLDGDGKPDLAVANGITNTVSVFRNTSASGNISFAAKMDYATGNVPTGVAIGDLDGDGKPDMAVANSSSNTISVFRNTSISGSISFASLVDFTVGNNPYSTAIADLNGDNKPDLAAMNSAVSGTVSTFQNNGTSGNVSFAPAVDYPTGSFSQSMATGDLDGDGKPDLAIMNSSITVLRNTNTSGNISFASGVNYPAGTYPTSIAIGDLDGDGKPDMVVVDYVSNTVSTLRNIVTSSTIPTIASFLPTSARSGDVVTITGTNFAGTTSVRFGSVAAASFTIVSPTTINAVVGTGATGAVSISAPGGTATSYGFNFLQNQTISFSDISAKIYGASDFNPGATASSGLAVSYSSNNPAVATIVSNNIHIKGTGSCTISANQGGNSSYAPAPVVSKTLTVTAKPLTISGVTASNKVYDGTTSATLTGGTLNGIVGTDAVTINAGSGLFADKNAGVSKAVIVSGYALTGSGAANYTLSGQPSGITADITPAPLTITAEDKTKAYGEPNPAFTMLYSGFLGGDTIISITAPTATCSADTASEAGTYDIVLSGGSATNYTLTLVNGVLTITSPAGDSVMTLNGVNDNHSYEKGKLMKIPATGATKVGYAVYPNPASDYVMIKTPDNTAVMVSIYNVAGVPVLKKEIVNGQLDLRGLKPGIYNLTINNFVCRLVKK